MAGPCVSLRCPTSGSGVFRLGESPERGHRPVAVFRERWLALLAAVILPGTGRDAAFRLYKESGPGGFAIETDNGGEPVGHSQLFDERLIEALHVVERLVRSPEALANVLEAAGPLALERAGAVLRRAGRGGLTRSGPRLGRQRPSLGRPVPRLGQPVL
jgi:hypothetical protein